MNKQTPLTLPAPTSIMVLTQSGYFLQMDLKWTEMDLKGPKKGPIIQINKQTTYTKPLLLFLQLFWGLCQ